RLMTKPSTRVPAAAGEAEGEAILALARLFDLDRLGEAAVKRGEALADFRDKLLDALAIAREPIQWPYDFELSKSAEAHGETVTMLTLRAPTASELLAAGLFDADVSGPQLLDLIATLAGKAPALIRALPGLEMLRLTTKLSRVFRQAAS
ncbi:MAG TPA: phage tail assembly protein, partial [Rudaea sp.]|nr:phage tail assembly protein [Rudaea sp.]